MKNYWKSIAWALLILALLLIKKVPVHKPELSFTGMDKIVHMFLFFVLSYLISVDAKQFRWTTALKFRLIVLLPVAYGAVLELIQLWLINGRSGEWLDLAADACGSLLCWIIIKKGNS